jgi:hypothetical protein
MSEAYWIEHKYSGAGFDQNGTLEEACKVASQACDGGTQSVYCVWTQTHLRKKTEWVKVAECNYKGISWIDLRSY